MRTTALALGLVTALILLGNGLGACAYRGDPRIPIYVPDPYIEAAGFQAMVTGAVLLGAAVLAKLALRTSLALFGVALLCAIWTVLLDYYSSFATRYFIALPLIGTCFIVMLVAWRKEKRTDSSVLDK